jgi:hypothetical protein
LIVEEQGRHLRAGPEPIPAARTDIRVDGVTELAELVDVASHRAGRDVEAFRELLARPFPPRLQQRQQGEQPGRGFQHEDILPHDADRFGPRLAERGRLVAVRQCGCPAHRPR